MARWPFGLYLRISLRLPRPGIASTLKGKPKGPVLLLEVRGSSSRWGIGAPTEDLRSPERPETEVLSRGICS